MAELRAFEGHRGAGAAVRRCGAMVSGLLALGLVAFALYAPAVHAGAKPPAVPAVQPVLGYGSSRALGERHAPDVVAPSQGFARRAPTLLRAPVSAPLALSYADGRAVVGFAHARVAHELAHDYGLEHVRYRDDLSAAVISAAPVEIQRLAGAVGSDRRLRYVEPLAGAFIDRRRDDPLTYEIDSRIAAPHQWWFSTIGLDRALNLSSGSASILVGVIDSGIVEVADLRGKIAEIWYERSVATDGVDRHGHGTAVTSVVAANNDDRFGLAGTCGGCRVVALKVGDGGGSTSSFALASAIRFIADRGIRVLNVSYSGPCTQVVFDALRYAVEERGILVVASSGNDYAGAVGCPAAMLQPAGGAASAGLAVGASDYNGNRASFSNYGANISLVAPGTFDSGLGVIAAAIPSGYAHLNGTSFSAPMVAGTAALILGARPDLNSAQLADLLKRSASVGQWTPDRGWGVLNAARALELATGRSSADTACADGFDNDGDGRTDYPADPGCLDAADNDESNPAAPPADQRPPTVRAFAGTYRPGAKTSLEYRVRDNGGETREVVAISNASGRRLNTIRTDFAEANGNDYFVTWRAPRSASGRLKFCVRASDRSGNSSGWSCAALRAIR